MNHLIETVETKNLIIRNTILKDEKDLNIIIESWDDKFEVEGEYFDEDYIKNCIMHGDLPPAENSNKDNYRLKSIVLKETNELIGFFDLYYGYPTNETVWTSIFLIDKSYRKRGLAQEVIEYITHNSKTAGFSKAGVGVHLKNWTGLRFWTKAGYDKIFTIYGDKKYSEKTYSLVGLEKCLQ